MPSDKKFQKQIPDSAAGDARSPILFGKEVICPQCGADAWAAEYIVPERQDVKLAADEKGEPYVEDWLGGTRQFDCSHDNERFVCTLCDYEIHFGDFCFVSVPGGPDFQVPEKDGE